MHVVLGLALIIALIAVHLATAFGGPTLPTVKSSAPKGYATTMQTEQNDDLPTLVDPARPIVRHTTSCDHTSRECSRECDPGDFTVQPAYEAMVDSVFDIARAYDIDPSEVLATLAAQVAEGDQR